MHGGGALWLLLMALGIVALGVAMAYASYMWRSARKDRRTRSKIDAAPRENYRQES
jgi:flagellar basal body-associated protein FliL